MLKEEYFNIENSKEFFDNLIKDLKEFTHKRSNPELSSSCLIVIDAQVYFTNSDSHAFVPSSASAIQNITKLIDHFRSLNLPVIFTKHYDDATVNNQMKSWWKGKIDNSAKEFELDQRIDTGNDLIVVKTEYDIFFGTDLENYLKSRKINNIFIAGFMTNLCCETSVRSAFIKNFKPFLIMDATATMNRKLHESTVYNLAHGFTFPVLTNEVINGIQ